MSRFPCQLYATLARWIFPGGGNRPEPETPAMAGWEPERNPGLDLAGVLTKLGDQKALLLKVLQKFGEQLPGTIELTRFLAEAK